MGTDIITQGYDLPAIQDEGFRSLLLNFNKKLNTPPPDSVIRERKLPGGGIVRYLPISHIEARLSEFFSAWETVDFRWQVVTNEIVGSINLRVWHPILQMWVTKTGAAATLIRQKKDSSISDVEAKLKNALEADFPHLKSDCVRNAASSLGKAFGSDLNRAEADTYNPYRALKVTEIDSFEKELEKIKKFASWEMATRDFVDNAKSEGDFKFLKDEFDKGRKIGVPQEAINDVYQYAMQQYNQWLRKIKK